MKGRVFRSPVCGFSMAHHRGRRLRMISRVRSTRRSPRARTRGRLRRACEYSVHTGLAHTMSKCPSEPSSSSMTSQQTVGRNLGSRSTETTSQPLSRKARPIDPVPEKSSRSLIFFQWVAEVPGKHDEAVAHDALGERHGRRRAEGLLVGRDHILFYHTRTDRRSERVALELPI